MFKRIFLLTVALVALSTGTVSAEYASGVSSGALLNLTNSYRASQGLGSLSINSQLSVAAQAKANDMVARDYWAHNSPVGRTPWSFIASTGYTFRAAGENLAYGYMDSSELINAWIASPEHRANLVGNYTEVGFGIANASDYQGTGPQTIVVAEYGLPYRASVPTTYVTTPEVKPEPKPQSLSVHTRELDLQAPFTNDLQVTIKGESLQG